MDLSKIKTALQSLLVEFESVKTKDGAEISYEGETLEVGVKVNVEDGTYVLEDETELVVKDGVVESLTAKEEEEVTEEVKEEDVKAEEEVTEEVVEEDNTVDELKAKVEELESRLTELETKLAELIATPAVEPIAEEFTKIDDKKIKGSSTANILSYMNK